MVKRFEYHSGVNLTRIGLTLKHKGLKFVNKDFLMISSGHGVTFVLIQFRLKDFLTVFSNHYCVSFTEISFFLQNLIFKSITTMI